MLIRAILACWLILASMCVTAADRQFMPVEAVNQAIEFDNGQAVIVTKSSRALVLVSIIPRDKKSAFLKIAIQNTSEQPFTVTESAIRARSGATALQILTYADRLKEQKRDQRWAAVGAGLQAAANNMNAANAGHSNTYGNYSSRTTATAYGSGGYAQANANTYGTYSGTTYNGAAAFAAQQHANNQNNAIFAKQRADAEYAKGDLDSRAFRANTLSPGEVVVGDVRFLLPKKSKVESAEITAELDVAGEIVVVTFREQ